MDKKEECNMDLACAGVNLVNEKNSDFLDYLGGNTHTKGNFGTSVASLIAPIQPATLEAHSHCAKKDFSRHWAKTKQMLYFRLYEVRRIVDLDVLTGEPNYLKGLPCAEIPESARTSVLPFKVTKPIADLLEHINELAKNDSDFRATLASVVGEIEKLSPTIAVSAMAAENRDPETKEALDVLSHKLAKHVSARDAKRVCWALLRRVHQNRMLAMRPNENWKGPTGSRTYARAVVNRIFASSRSLRL